MSRIESHLLFWGGAIALCAAALGHLAMTAGSRGAMAQEIDLAAIFSCDGARAGGLSAPDCAAARGAIMQNCTSCHTFVPIVKAQKTPEEWTSTLGQHRERVADVSEAQYKQIGALLAGNFNPQNEPPTLPPELEALGTQQAF